MLLCLKQIVFPFKLLGFWVLQQLNWDRNSCWSFISQNLMIQRPVDGLFWLLKRLRTIFDNLLHKGKGFNSCSFNNVNHYESLNTIISRLILLGSFCGNWSAHWMPDYYYWTLREPFQHPFQNNSCIKHKIFCRKIFVRLLWIPMATKIKRDKHCKLLNFFC